MRRSDLTVPSRSSSLWTPARKSQWCHHYSHTHTLHLVTSHQKVTLSATIGCPVDLTEVQSGRWTLGSDSLETQLIASLPASGLKADGLIGSDVLSRDGAVVIDYRGARLLLESG